MKNWRLQVSHLRTFQFRNPVKQVNGLLEHLVRLVKHGVKPFIAPNLSCDLRLHVNSEELLLFSQLHIVGFDIISIAGLRKVFQHFVCDSEVREKMLESLLLKFFLVFFSKIKSVLLQGGGGIKFVKIVAVRVVSNGTK